LVKFASKSIASRYFAVLLRCALAVGFKRLGGFNVAFMVLNKRQIAHIGATVKIALRKDKLLLITMVFD
jgi:hypothetical protein